MITAKASDKDNETFKRIPELDQGNIVNAIKDDTKGVAYLVKLTPDELDAAFANFLD